MPKGSLIVVGAGIKCLSHLTTEAKTHIEQSDVVLYLVNDPVMKEWIKANNINSQSLDQLYFKNSSRLKSYKAITSHILQTLRKSLNVCVVIYGHPTVFAQPALDAVLRAKSENFYTKILPGISAEDCLFADLMFDPGTFGCQSFEATDFLVRRKKFDCTTNLILWQIGFIGDLGNDASYDNETGIKLLVQYLATQYPLFHLAFIYEAAQYPGSDPVVVPVVIEKLPEAHLTRISTLYVPPVSQAPCDTKILKALKIKKS